MITVVMSSTRMPASRPLLVPEASAAALMLSPNDPCRIFFVRRRVDDQHLGGLITGHGKYMRHAGGKEATISGSHLLAFAADLGNGAALEQVAHLLDLRMRMRQRARSGLDRAVHDLEALGTNRLGADQPPIEGAGVIGGMIAAHILGADEVAAAGSCLFRHRSYECHCASMPESLISFVHNTSCSCTNWLSSCGVPENASKPASPSRRLTSGLSMILRSSAFRRPTTSAGVPAGANTPAHEVMS